MALELVYWIALAGGLGFLLLSLLLGDIFDFLHIDLPGSDISAMPVFFAAAAAFGVGGLFGLKGLDMGTPGSIGVGLLTGVAMGALTGVLFALLRRQESPGGFELTQLVGQRGRCTLAIGPSKVGRVQITFAGMTRSLSAMSNDQVQAGEEVVVRDVIGRTLTVSRSGSD